MTYDIKGSPMPVVICNLENGETLKTEAGSMVWMTPNMVMQTESGGIGKAFGRILSGENLFQNLYTAKGGPGTIAFATSFPGDIKAVEIHPGMDIICQKSAFLASTAGVELSTFFQNKAMTGFFGGEGFVMQKLSGDGIAFIEIDGSAVEYGLQHGEQLIVDTGALAMMDATVKMEVKRVPGMKNALLGGEGLFNTVLTGPGRVTLQTLPIYSVAKQIAMYLPTSK